MTHHNEAQAFSSNENPAWEAVASSLGSHIYSRHMDFAEQVEQYHTPRVPYMSIPAGGAAALARSISQRAGWNSALVDRVSGLSHRISRWRRLTDPSAQPVNMLWFDRERKGRVGFEEHIDVPSAEFPQAASTARESVHIGTRITPIQRGIKGGPDSAIARSSQFAGARFEKSQRFPAASSRPELGSARRVPVSPVTIGGTLPLTPSGSSGTPGSGTYQRQEKPAALEERSLLAHHHPTTPGDTTTASQQREVVDMSRGKADHPVPPAHLGPDIPVGVPPANQLGRVPMSSEGQNQLDSRASDEEVAKARPHIPLRQMWGLISQKALGPMAGTPPVRVTGLRSIKLPFHRTVTRSAQDSEPEHTRGSEVPPSRLTPASIGDDAALADRPTYDKKPADRVAVPSTTKPSTRKRLPMSFPILGRKSSEQPHRVEHPRLDEVAQATGHQAPATRTPIGEVKIPPKTRLKMPFLINRAADGEDVRRIVTPDKAAPPRIPETKSQAYRSGAPEAPSSMAGTGSRGARPEGRHDQAEDKPFAEAVSQKYRSAQSLYRGETMKHPTSIKHLSEQAWPVMGSWPESGPLGRLVDDRVANKPFVSGLGGPVSFEGTRDLNSIVNAGGMVWRRMAESIGGNIPLPTMPIRKELSIIQASLNTATRDYTGSISRQRRDSRPELVLAAVPERPHIDRSSSNVSLAPVQAAGETAAGDTGPAESGGSAGGHADSDAMAREVYTIIRRRLQVEKERIGY